MIVIVCDFDLANLLGGVVAIDLGQNTNFESPVGWNAQSFKQVDAHGELACQRIAKAVEVIQKMLLWKYALHRPHQGGNQQTTHPAI